MKRLFAMTGLVLFFLGGCGRNAAPQPWTTLQHTDGGSNATCVITLHSPPYGKNAREPDTISVFWDGKEIFTGKLPSDDGSGPTGMPFTFAEIRTVPGKHVLMVKHVERSHTETLELKTDEQRHYYLFGGDNKGNEVLLEDLGPSPMFI